MHSLNGPQYDLNTTSKVTKVKVVHFGTNRFLVASYRLSIATFALGRTVYPQYIMSQRDDDGRNTAGPLVRSAKNKLELN